MAGTLNGLVSSVSGFIPCPPAVSKHAWREGARTRAETDAPPVGKSTVGASRPSASGPRPNNFCCWRSFWLSIGLRPARLAFCSAISPPSGYWATERPPSCRKTSTARDFGRVQTFDATGGCWQPTGASPWQQNPIGLRQRCPHNVDAISRKWCSYMMRGLASTDPPTDDPRATYASTGRRGPCRAGHPTAAIRCAGDLKEAVACSRRLDARYLETRTASARHQD